MVSSDPEMGRKQRPLRQPLSETQEMGPDTLDHQAEFIFIQGTMVVGTVVADCAVCAWKEGHPSWPAARMAVWTAPIEGHHECARQGKPGDRLSERLNDMGRQN